VVLEALAEDELMLVDDAGAVAGDVGGADVDESPQRLAGRAELERVAGAVDVDAAGEPEGTARS
jgi:hypothetical protein